MHHWIFVLKNLRFLAYANLRFATTLIHRSPDESSQRIPYSKIQPFYVRCIDRLTIKFTFRIDLSQIP